MILKERTYPLVLLQLKALIKRLHPQHERRSLVIEDFKKREAGYKGEVSLDYHLSFIDSQLYSILHDLRLPDERGRFFQVDTLIVSKKMMIAVEIKNIMGTLYFDSVFNQLIRTKEGIESGFGDPISQVQKHSLQLKGFLKRHNQPELPVCPLVVVTSPQSVIKTSSDHRKISNIVTHSINLPAKVSQLDEIYSKEVMNEKEIKKMARILIRQHVELRYSVLEKYRIKAHELIKGVICQNCEYHPLKRIRGNWYCNKCKWKNPDAHLEAIEDYSLLISPVITNRQLRDFLLIDSSTIAKKLLQSQNLSHNGKNKGRIYYLPPH
ncbi:nuclease-related domain-containing protein [Litchfieldia alkalitelluris]|uniref:nuclease-related domain-containing protein n=1 Tax=Litchfieldia alkalitelluris TaxID=304268 RepID=UPI00099706D2|nr:nuclease-related domain-containing protein [Litchfieldia alkalitelluris]